MLQLREEVIDSLVTIRMRPAHKAVTDETDVERFEVLHGSHFSKIAGNKTEKTKLAILFNLPVA